MELQFLYTFLILGAFCLVFGLLNCETGKESSEQTATCRFFASGLLFSIIGMVISAICAVWS